MNVRHAALSDIAAVTALDKREMGSDKRAQRIKAAISEGRCRVAEAEGRIIGFAVLNRDFFDQPFIALLMVDRDYRRQGAGTALLHGCKAHAPGKLFTSTNQSNRAMQGLLEKAKFVRCGYIDGLDEGDRELVYYTKNERVDG